jgi:glycosyltransferase involved in cell wall biosynthesis
MTARTILHAFSTFDLGGPEGRFAQIANALGNEYRHTVVAMDGRYGAAERLHGNAVELLRIPVRKGAGFPNFTLLRDLLKQRQPDQLLTYNFGAFEWLFSNWGLGIPHAHVEEGFGRDESQRRLPRRNLIRRAGIGLSRTKVITVSQTLQHIAKTEWGVPSKRLFMIPNGIDVTRFSKCASRPPFSGGPNARTIIGTVARLRPEKRIDRLIDAFAALLTHYSADAAPRLLITGDGPERSALEELARAKCPPDSVEFLGHHNDLDQIYARMDVFALSSDTEQMPISILEAMAAGRCIVSTDVGDIRHMLTWDSQRFLCAPEVSALAATLTHALANPASALTLAQKNHQHVAQHFSEHAMLARWRRVFDNTL